MIGLMALGLASCNRQHECPHAAAANAQYPKIIKAVAIVTPTKGNQAHGVVTFTQQSKGVLVEADMLGLAPGLHGFHVHEFGDISSEDGAACGGHFNPDGHEHGGPGHQRHAGDLGNIEADATGHGKYSWIDPEMDLNGAHSVIGRSVIVHINPDDMVTQPSGGAGARIGQGAIGISKVE